MILFLVGCATLDSFLFNPVHCSTVSEATCDGSDWDSICAACDEPYAWDAEHPWFPGQLGEGQTIRAPAVVERIPIETDDGLATLDAYWIPSHGERPERSGTTVLYNHGNYAGIEHYRPRLRVLHELGFNVLVWDYRGYGKSEPASVPTPEQFLADARQVRALAGTLAPDPDRVVIYGYSLGGIPAVEAALADPPCGLALEAPFTSVRLVARSNSTVNLPETFLSEGAYENIRKIEGYTGPLLAMGGTADTFFPWTDVRTLAEAAGGPTRTWFPEGVHHGVSDIGIVEAGVPAYDAELAAWLSSDAAGCVGAPQQ